MIQYIISKGAGKKSRAFSAYLAGWLNWDGGWEMGKTQGPARPVWMLWTSSPDELRAFVANLRTGRRAESVVSTTTIELPKKAPYAYHWSGPDTVEVYLPELFALEPEDSSQFILNPPASWVAAQGQPEADALAALFAAYIDRRTAVPVLNDGRFHSALYDRAIEKGFLRESDSQPRLNYRSQALLRSSSWDALPFHTPHAFVCADVDRFVIDTTTTFLEEHDYGPSRIQSPRGIFSNTPDAGQQLCLFGAA